MARSPARGSGTAPRNQARLHGSAEHPVLDSGAAQRAEKCLPARVELTRATVPIGVVPG
jgi:hypothetical protein